MVRIKSLASLGMAQKIGGAEDQPSEPLCGVSSGPVGVNPLSTDPMISSACSSDRLKAALRKEEKPAT